MFRDLRLFLGEFVSSFTTTGAIAPSSPALARAMLAPLSRRPDRPIAVLEIGPGTGAFTRPLLRRLRAGDEVDLYELNPKFHAYLQQSLVRERCAARGIHCRLHHADFLTKPRTRRYDYIISGLPLANFDAATVNRILKSYLAHLAPKGTLSYFEYSFLHRLRLRFLDRAARDRVEGSAAVVKSFLHRHQFECRHVWLNLPPAFARHCRKQAES